jgi:hypothetical protein
VSAGRLARTPIPKTTLGAPSSVLEGGAFDFAFSHSSRTHRNQSTALITVQPSISTIHCKILNNLIRPCYSLPCTPSPVTELIPWARSLAPTPPLALRNEE